MSNCNQLPGGVSCSRSHNVGATNRMDLVPSERYCPPPPTRLRMSQQKSDLLHSSQLFPQTLSSTATGFLILSHFSFSEPPSPSQFTPTTAMPHPDDFFPFASREESFEDIGKYGPGGLHPVLLGDILPKPSTCVSQPNKNPRYRIDLKIGFGAFSIVWLAFDLQTR